MNFVTSRVLQITKCFKAMRPTDGLSCCQAAVLNRAAKPWHRSSSVLTDWLSSTVGPVLSLELISLFIIHQIFSLTRDWSKRETWANIPQLKLVNRWIINTVASIWLRKYARIFVLGHYLFLEAHSFPRALLSENCSLLRTDNVRGQISEHIFAPNEGYCLYNRLVSRRPSCYIVTTLLGLVLFFNGNRFEEWSPILSVIIRDIYKIGRLRSGSPTCQWRVSLHTQLDDTKPYNQLIINAENSPFHDFVSKFGFWDLVVVATVIVL